MRYDLSQILPWGRSFDEYVRMFDLEDEHLSKSFLGCADGPASFNAEMNRRGYRVVSCDPIYRFSKQQLKNRIDQACDEIVEQTKKNAGNFVWSSIRSIDQLREIRMSAMNYFLQDYDQGKKEGRYLDSELPILSFDDRSFDIALCSHFLFLYADRLSMEFHQKSILELCRVADEVRVFPLIDLDLKPCVYVKPVIEALAKSGLTVSIDHVPYESQRGGN